MYSLLVDYKYLEARDTLLLLPPTFFFPLTRQSKIR